MPKKLVEKIQASEYVDMAVLLPDCLGTHGTTPGSEEKKSKRAKHQISSIAEWVQCFSVYMVMVTAKGPERIADLLGYQAIIVEAAREYKGETWQVYDRRFRQMASA